MPPRGVALVTVAAEPNQDSGLRSSKETALSTVGEGRQTIIAAPWAGVSGADAARQGVARRLAAARSLP